MSFVRQYIWLVEDVKLDELLNSFSKIGLIAEERKRVFKISQEGRHGSFMIDTYINDGVVRTLLVKSFKGLDLAQRVCIYLRIPIINRQLCVDYQEECNQKKQKGKKELFEILRPHLYKRYYGIKSLENYHHVVEVEHEQKKQANC